MKKKFIDRQIKNRYLIYIIFAGYLLGLFFNSLLNNIVGMWNYEKRK